MKRTISRRASRLVVLSTIVAVAVIHFGCKSIEEEPPIDIIPSDLPIIEVKDVTTPLDKDDPVVIKIKTRTPINGKSLFVKKHDAMVSRVSVSAVLADGTTASKTVPLPPSGIQPVQPGVDHIHEMEIVLPGVAPWDVVTYHVVADAVFTFEASNGAVLADTLQSTGSAPGLAGYVKLRFIERPLEVARDEIIVELDMSRPEGLTLVTKVASSEFHSVVVVDAIKADGSVGATEETLLDAANPAVGGGASFFDDAAAHDGRIKVTAGTPDLTGAVALRVTIWFWESDASGSRLRRVSEVFRMI